jgi:hypothetical protein
METPAVAPTETAPPLRILLVLILAPLLCVLPFAVAAYLEPTAIFAVRDVLAGLGLAGVAALLARRLTR